MHLHLELPNPCAIPELNESFFCNNLFVGANMRSAVAEGRSSYIPLFLSEVPTSMRQGYLRCVRTEEVSFTELARYGADEARTYRCVAYRYALLLAALESLRLAPTGRSWCRGADYSCEPSLRGERIFFSFSRSE